MWKGEKFFAGEGAHEKAQKRGRMVHLENGEKDTLIKIWGISFNGAASAESWVSHFNLFHLSASISQEAILDIDVKFQLRRYYQVIWIPS